MRKKKSAVESAADAERLNRLTRCEKAVVNRLLTSSCHIKDLDKLGYSSKLIDAAVLNLLHRRVIVWLGGFKYHYNRKFYQHGVEPKREGR